jgi:hypothetical protein
MPILILDQVTCSISFGLYNPEPLQQFIGGYRSFSHFSAHDLQDIFTIKRKLLIRVLTDVKNIKAET